VGAACTLTPPGREDDTVGFPIYGFDFKIQDEETKEFFDISGGERRGGLFIAGDSLSSGELDGVRYFGHTMINGKKYFCTNDLFQVNADGTLTCCGRMNQYFVNNDGVRFDAGLIENEVGKQNGVEECVILPAFDKNMNDTVPIMFIQLRKHDFPLQRIHQIFKEVFIEGDAFKKTNLPVQVVFVESMPYNQSGKVDRYKMDVGTKDGKRFLVQPFYRDGVLKDIAFVPALRNDFYHGSLPEELKERKEEDFEERMKNPKDLLNLPPFLTSVFRMDLSVNHNEKNNKKSIVGGLFEMKDQEKCPFAKLFP